MKFLGENDEINLNTAKPEFLEWKWIDPSELTNVVVEFKIEVYKKLKKELNFLNLIQTLISLSASNF